MYSSIATKKLDEKTFFFHPTILSEVIYQTLSVRGNVTELNITIKPSHDLPSTLMFVAFCSGDSILIGWGQSWSQVEVATNIKKQCSHSDAVHVKYERGPIACSVTRKFLRGRLLKKFKLHN